MINFNSIHVYYNIVCLSNHHTALPLQPGEIKTRAQNVVSFKFSPWALWWLVMVRKELTLKESSRSILTVRCYLESSVMPNKWYDNVKEKYKNSDHFLQYRQAESSIKHRKYMQGRALQPYLLCAVLSLRSLITNPNSQSQIVSKNPRLFLRDSL